MSNPVIIPNANPNLVVLCTWNAPGVEGTSEFPIIAWRIVEGEAPVPISTEGEMGEPDAGCAAMVYDRVTQIGAFQGATAYKREACVKELHDAIASCNDKQVKS